MLILGVDTSGKNGSLALVRFEAGNASTLEIVPLEGGTFSAQMVPQISRMLGDSGLTKREIDAITVVSGPGSFTGLRVGLAAVKALAEALHKPIATVTLLEAAALSSGSEGQVTAAIDAGRGEIYCGEYIIENFRASLLEQSLLTWDELVSEVTERILVTPDAKLAERIRERRLEVQLIPPAKADLIARIGFDKIVRGETISPELLDAD